MRETFLQQLKQLMHKPKVDIWFADESGFEGDPRPRKRWDKKGSKTRVTKNGGHLRMNVIGIRTQNPFGFGGPGFVIFVIEHK